MSRSEYPASRPTIGSFDVWQTIGVAADHGIMKVRLAIEFVEYPLTTAVAFMAVVIHTVKLFAYLLELLVGVDPVRLWLLTLLVQRG